MGLYMRAILSTWDDQPFDELATFVAEHSPFHVLPIGPSGWEEFEVLDGQDATVLAADLTTGEAMRDEVEELEEFLDELEGPSSSKEVVRSHLREATAVIGMQILPSVYDQSVEAANAVIGFFERRPGVLTQVDTVGWYDGPELILREPE